MAAVLQRDRSNADANGGEEIPAGRFDVVVK
jgi:hypothetical protein